MIEEIESLLDGRLTGRQAFCDTIERAIEQAPRRGWRKAVLCDADFADWPLGSRAVASALDVWASSGARFTLLATRYDDLMRRHPRFVDWRIRWSHQIECWQLHKSSKSALPSVLWTPSWMLHRLDPARSVCLVSIDAVRRTAMQESIAESLRISTAAFPATTLGL